jgi:hypothetical protein
MKNQLIILAAATATAVALTQSAQAVPITGVIGFAGHATVDTAHANTASEVLTWGANIIAIQSGVFASLTPASTVALASPWFFNSSSLNNFWVVTDGTATYRFNLTSSHETSTSATSATILLTGTVISSVLGLDPTAFTGNFTLQDPSVANGNVFKYSESMSFGSVPDGASTSLLLGGTLTGLGLVRRRISGKPACQG